MSRTVVYLKCKVRYLQQALIRHLLETHCYVILIYIVREGDAFTITNLIFTVLAKRTTIFHVHDDQQSARFLGPPRERSPSLPGPLNNSCNVGNNNHPLHRPCSSCPEQCDSSKHFGPSPIFNESCRSYETPERTIFDESGMGFMDSSSRVECTEMRSGGTSCLELKSEPIGPSSPESSSELLTGPDDCAGCGRLIQDRFFLSAVEKRWHIGCLQCCICRQLLESETSCFSRDGNIYCKSDYYRTNIDSRLV
ncbi:Protein apterous [Pseudolycoriella hygida]|uniref:Protein apterous n=1 Tax=Pseudolycoriella hygida TaxID=35572 RepID=A0A9Q0S422_9DIPT|nr:Protein apterous [Pseudolycoriella hygida]